MDLSNLLGELLAKRAKDKKISSVYFDRGGYKYHGRIKALADSARKYNLKQHIQSVHDAIKCFFYQCDYEPTCKTHLKIHMQYIHKGFNISLVVINGNMNLLGRII